jgi:hypothetical protein
MSTLLVSLPVILVPLFLVAKQLGLLDSYAGLIVPSIFHAFGIFLLRLYYLNIPRELEEAADLDGCGCWRRYWSVILPLSRPVLASLSMLFFLANWNAFLWSLTITRNPDVRVIQRLRRHQRWKAGLVVRGHSSQRRRPRPRLRPLRRQQRLDPLHLHRLERPLPNRPRHPRHPASTPQASTPGSNPTTSPSARARGVGRGWARPRDRQVCGRRTRR